MKKENSIRLNKISRLAPSPSGRIHLGNIYSFLIAWADARQTNATFKFRMDDLDERCKNTIYQEQIISDLKWLGIDWDGRIEFQNSHKKLYDEVWECLVQTNLLYPCFCSRADLHTASAPHECTKTPIYPEYCKNLTFQQIKEKSQHKSPAWRIEVPNITMSFTDEIFGPQRQNLKKDCGDFVLKRSDSIYAYHFCNAVDDLSMGVTRVIRGCDLLPYTHRQIWLRDLIYQNCKDIFASNKNISYAHIPMIINTNGKRLAKRDHSLDIGTLQKRGIKPETIIGTIANLIGLTQIKENLSAKEFLQIFDISSLKNKTKIVVNENLFL